MNPPSFSLSLFLPALLLAASPALCETRAEAASVSAQLTPSDSHLIVEARGVLPKVPFFFTASADSVITLSRTQIESVSQVTIRVVQGRPEVITLGLLGDGTLTEVTGAGLDAWAVRTVAGKRFLDLRPALAEGKPAPDEIAVTVKARVERPGFPGRIALPTLTAGNAVGFQSKISLAPDSAVDVRVVRADGLVPFGWDADARRTPQFVVTGEPRLDVSLVPRGAVTADTELVGVRLQGTLDEAAGCVRFHLRAEARVRTAGARLPLLSGRAALSGPVGGKDWHGEATDGQTELVFDRAGSFPVELSFVAALIPGDWTGLDFRLAAGAIVPMVLDGLPKEISFNPASAVVPDAATRTGFLTADGRASVAWKPTRTAGHGQLAFTSQEVGDVRVGAGLLRQTSQMDLRILQGKLTELRVHLDGPGEILGVKSDNILAWKVVPSPAGRVLEIQWSRPLEKNGSFLVESQTPLENFPLQAQPLRFTPEGGVRHSGVLRVTNDGAVRLEMGGLTGLLQLAPEQFPGPELSARQVFVFRFPSAQYTCRIHAAQVQAELAVSQITLYQMDDTDRVITADLELDIREAPLREWALGIPEDYAVVSVTGAPVADYLVEGTAHNGRRVLKVLFKEAVDGRHLVHLRLEKSQPAAAGEWALPALTFPGARSVRGHIGVVATPGFRMLPGSLGHLSEVPLSFFPTQIPGLQLAWRLREADWSATVSAEALGQSILADGFHLVSLKPGVVSSSVLLNYFVVGAPVSEWRVEVPASAGNLDVTGLNVRRDWRREGNQIIIPLHQPVLGAAPLLVTFEEPLSARGGTITPGAVRPLGVQAERGYVQVVSPFQVKAEVRKTEGSLLRLDPLDLPAEYRLLSSSPSLAVMQYTARPFALEMDIAWFAAAETVDQVVDFAQLTSRVSRDGEVVTDARYFVKTRGRKALRLTLPPGTRLWEARADHQIVNAQVDGADTLVALPPRLNPNEPVEVSLRFGETFRNPTKVALRSPVALAPTLLSEWTVAADSGQALIPRRGTAQLATPALAETGFEWMTRRAPTASLVLLGGIAAASLLLRAGGTWRSLVGLVVAAAVVFGALHLALTSRKERRPPLSTLTFSATVVPAHEAVTLELANVSASRAIMSPMGIVGMVAGCAALGLAAMRQGARSLLAAAGALALAAGVLAQRGGASGFYFLLGGVVFLVLVLPAFLRGMRASRASVRPAAATLFLTGFLVFPPAPACAAQAAESIAETWTIRDGRLFGEVAVTVRGGPGDSFVFLRPPATLTGFQGDEGLRVTTVPRDGEVLYSLALEKAGVFHATATFEMPCPDLTKGLPLVAGPSATRKVTVRLDQGGWEFYSPDAVSVQSLPKLSGNESGATLLLTASDLAVIHLRPRIRDTAAEKPRFFVEAANLFLPGPGVVNGTCRLTIRPVQGRITSLEVRVPKGFTVGDVRNGPVADWRFDPQTGRLRVEVGPAQTSPFSVDVETQLGTADLPVDLVLDPVRVEGAEGEVGLIALAFGLDAQPENVRGVSPVSTGDFDSSLLPSDKEGRPLATLQSAFRYGPDGGRIALRLAPVAPEVRVTGKQVFSFGDDRLVLAADLGVAITRAGLFRLSFALPDGLEVETISGPALSQWTEATENGQRIITLQLQGRTLGQQNFALTLVGPAPAAQDSWPVPRLSLREATRQTGEIFLVPDKGLRLRATDRDGISQMDARAAGEPRPGTLAFRLLQDAWSLRLGIEALAPWVTVQALQEVTLREGQTLTRLNLRYRVENAAIKTLRLRLPGLTENQARTVRGTGSAVSDLVPVSGEKDTWEIRFQRGIAGETDVEIEFQGTVSPDADGETIQTPVYEGVRQVVQFVSVRAGGRMGIEASATPRGWQWADWSGVPSALQQRTDRSVPALCFRVTEPEGPLVLSLRRHETADALKLRVTQADLTTLLSPAGSSLTAVQLSMQVLEKSSLRVTLPKEARLFSAFVNESSAALVRDGEAWLLSAQPPADPNRPATVRLVYSLSDATGRGIRLDAPGLHVPLVNVTWRVIVPAGQRLVRSSGDLLLKEETSVGTFHLKDYMALASGRRHTESQVANALIEQAQALLKEGNPQAAGEILSRAANGFGLDEATNEDARVQLKTLKTQQAIVGLNTRRQRLYLDNRGTDTLRNEQLEQAAHANPFMQGASRLDLRQMDQFLMGNTSDENTALRGIADRIVSQQLAAEPPPSAIDVTLPESGSRFTFTRSIQVNGETPLGLRLHLAPIRASHPWSALAILLAVAGIAGLMVPRRMPKSSVDQPMGGAEKGGRF